MEKIVIVTTTFYRSVDELRFRLACDMVKAAVALGHIVVVVDGSPIQEIASALVTLGAQVYPQLHKGMGPSRREAFFHAWEVATQENVDYLLWTEPEKVDIIRWIEKIISPLTERQADIVIPARTKVAWDTWPTFQVESEVKANTIYNNVFGLQGFDPMFGPVAFATQFTSWFILCDSKLWGVPDTYVQLYAPPIARRNEVRVVSVGVDMIYPPEQRKQEEGSANTEMLEKRKWQLETLTSAYQKLARRLRQTRYML